MIELDDDLATDYLAESRDHLSNIEADLLALEAGGAEIDEELVNRFFRAVHSVKGGAGFFDLPKLRELAHRTEDVLAKIRSRKMTPTTEQIRVLLRATDKLRDMIENAHVGNQADIADIMGALEGLTPDRQAAAVPASVIAIAPAPADGARLRILLAEDDFASRLVLQIFLSRYGECHVAVNGIEAVALFRSAFEMGRRYDLICMDIMMPEMNGREAVRQVRAMEEAQGVRSTQGAKIIMTTAVDEVKEVIRCFQELCDAYLIKPIDLANLLEHMRSLQLVR